MQGRRNGGGARHADGGRSAGRARGAAGVRRAARTKGHHMDEAVRRRSALPHHRQESAGTFRGVRGHRGGGRHHRQADE